MGGDRMKYQKKNNKKQAKANFPNAYATNTVVMKAETGEMGVPKPSLEDVEIAREWEQEHKV